MKEITKEKIYNTHLLKTEKGKRGNELFEMNAMENLIVDRENGSGLYTCVDEDGNEQTFTKQELRRMGLREPRTSELTIYDDDLGDKLHRYVVVLTMGDDEEIYRGDCRIQRLDDYTIDDVEEDVDWAMCQLQDTWMFNELTSEEEDTIEDAIREELEFYVD